MRVRLWLIALSIVCVGDAGAQTLESAAGEPATGTWYGIGAGGGWARVSCAICSAARDIGPAAQLRIGTTIRPGLLVGGEASAWTHTSEDDVRETVGTIAAIGYVYPRPGGPLYLKGGAGYVAFRAGDDLASNLLGLIVGVGYEFRVGEALSITNDLGLIASSFGALKNGAATAADDVSVTVLQFGIGVRRR
jgi:hypothetical protein